MFAGPETPTELFQMYGLGLFEEGKRRDYELLVSPHGLALRPRGPQGSQPSSSRARPGISVGRVCGRVGDRLKERCSPKDFPLLPCIRVVGSGGTGEGYSNLQLFPLSRGRRGVTR